jgi:dihydroneopterin aldolase
MDSLLLSGLQFHGHHGTEPWERETGRRFEVDLELFMDMSAAGRSDRLRDALDYRRIYELARAVVEGESHRLIERVTWRLMEALMREFPTVQRARVRVSKAEAPIGGINRAATVTLDRDRDAWARQAGADLQR